MPKIVEERSYNGVENKIARLGMSALLDEVRGTITGFELRVMEQKDSNGGAAIRKLMDARFQGMKGWSKRQTGAVDWTKCQTINGTKVCVGVEIQVSARSDLLVMDIAHLRKEITEGQIDVGVLVVPSDRLGSFLTDRAPRFSDATRHVIQARAEDLPLVIFALEHDGPGDALAKQPRARS